MAVEQIDSFLSSNAERQFELMKEAAPQLIAIGKSFVETNAKISKSENARSETVKGLRDNIKGLDEEMKQLLKLSLEYQYQTSETAKKEALLRKQIQDARKANQEYAKSVTETTDAYRKLEIEHKKLEGQAKQLGAIYGANSKEFKEAAAAANEYGNKLKAIDAGLGNHRRNVGNYASAFNGLGMSIQQVARELPNFALNFQTGIAALSNNIPILADEIKRVRVENAELIAQGKPTVSLFKQIAASVFSWQTALTLAITALVAYSKEIGEFFKGAVTASEKLIESNKKINASFSEEAKNLSVLKSRFEDVTSSMSDKQEVVDELNKKYGDQIGKIKGVSDAEKFFRETTPLMIKALELRAKAEAALSLIREESANQLKLESDPASALNGVDKALIGIGAAGKFLRGGGKLSDIYNWDVVVQGAEKANRELRTSRSLTDGLLKDYIRLQNEASGIDEQIGIDTGGGADRDKKTKAEKQQKEFYQTYLKSLKDRNDAKRDYDIQEYEQEMARSEAIIKNEEETLDNRLAALDAYYEAKNGKQAIDTNKELQDLEDEQTVLLQKQADFDAKKLKLTDLQHKTLVNQIETVNLRIKSINEKRDSEIIQNEIDLQEKRLNIIEKYGQEEVRAALANLKAISGNFQGSGSRTRDQAEVIREQISYLEEFRAILAAEGVNVDALTEKINELNAALGKTPKQWELTARSIADVVREIQPIVNELAGLVNDIYQRRLENLDKESEKIRQNGEKEIENINKQALTQEEKERRIQIAQAKTDAEQQIIEQRRRQAELQQARFNRAANITDIISKIALAVITALTEGDPYTKVARAAIAGALGAAQLARVIATPLPSYAEGTLDHPGGKARVGESGPEMIVTPDGKIRSVSHETVLDLPQHSKVFNEDQLKQMGMFYPKMFKDSHNDYNFERLEMALEKGFTKLDRTIKRKNNNAYVTVQGVDNYKKFHTRGK